MPIKTEVLATSITTFSTNPNLGNKNPEELFLVFSKGIEEGSGRGINRDGIGSPWVWDEKLTNKETDPDEQRRGSWLIDRDLALKIEQKALNDKRKNQGFIKKFEAKGLDPQLFLDQRLKELEDTPDFISEFEKIYNPKGYSVVGVQGCGNLTMNSWFVGYVNSDFTENKSAYLYRREEPFQERQYTSLVKWSDPKRYSIESLKFNLYEKEITRIGDETREDISKSIEFAVFGQRLVKNGEMEDFGNIVKQFEDIRHLFRLPNINSNDEFPEVYQPKRPRMLFGEPRFDDVWFGERQLTSPHYVDLLTHALTEPIILNTQFENMGAGLDLIRATFAAYTGGGYRELIGEQANYRPRSRGEWRVYGSDSIEIFLQRNVYAYTMMGIDKTGNIIASAAGGLAGRIGQTLEGMAQNMISAGAQDVLLMDEGNDVFQKINGKYTVEPRRGRLRAAFILAAQK